MVFESGQIKITERQDEAFRNAFRHVDFPEVYERMAAWLVANPQKLEKPGMFIYRWLGQYTSAGSRASRPGHTRCREIVLTRMGMGGFESSTSLA